MYQETEPFTTRLTRYKSKERDIKNEHNWQVGS